MPINLLSLSGLVCERVLQERDGVFSAIRIVEIFNVPEGIHEDATIQFYVLAILRATEATSEEFRIGVTLIRSSGERDRMPDPPNQPYRMPAPIEGAPEAPPGLTIVIQMNVKPKNMGTAFVEIDVDGTIIRIPFTLRRPPVAEQNQ